MKVFRIPCFVLLLLLTVCLFNSNAVSKRCHDWDTQIDTIDQCVQGQHWNTAAADLETLYEDWNTCQTWFHIVIEHSEIDNAEALLQRCRILCQEQDSVEFRATLADLRSQLILLDEMERVSIKNIM